MRIPTLVFTSLMLLFGFVSRALPEGKQVDRAERKQPDIFLDTGGRTGTLDALTFTADGKSLLAAGEDKVVRSWRVSDEGLDRDARILRWPAWREQRGAIFAMALSRDDDQALIAVAGYGIRTGTITILDRSSGEIVRSLTDSRDTHDTSAKRRSNSQTIVSLAFSPSGKRVAYGTWDGNIWLWNRTAKEIDHRFVGDSRPTARRDDKKFNVRLVHFEDEDTLITTAQDGRVLEWNLKRERSEPKERFRFGDGTENDLYRVVLSPDGKWLAGAHRGRLVELRSFRDGKAVRPIRLEKDEFCRSLAFDPTGERIALGINWNSESGFFNQQAGKVRIYEYGKQKPQFGGIELGNAYQVEGLAFAPDGKQLAVGGGDNQEVTLWDLETKKTKSRIRGVGSCLWGVTLSEDGRYLGFSEEREPNPKSANERARLPMADHWRAFDFDQRKFVRPGAIKNPYRPLEECRGWTVEADPQVITRLYVKSPSGKRLLPTDPSQDQVPFCWTFLKPQRRGPVRLLVGHQWGVSLFEIPEGGEPQRKRLYTGHQGEVMSLAVSKNQQWFVSCSRDQTVSAWSLKDWDHQSELGASFRESRGRIIVEHVDFGSPAWEAGLMEDDVVALFKFDVSKFVYDPQHDRGNIPDCLARLHHPVPGREFYFEVMRGDDRIAMLTTVRQRPLWRFFPAGDEWILWMWKGNYYDCSTNGDSNIGWQLNSKKDLYGTPAFYKAEQFRELFNRRDVVDKLLEKRDLLEAFRVARGDGQADGQYTPVEFDRIEPPSVRIRVAKVGDRKSIGAGDSARTGTDDVTLELIADPRGDNPDYQPQDVNLWINGYLFQEFKAGGKRFRQEVTVPNRLLRRGDNEVTLQVYNRIMLGKAKSLGGRAEKSLHIECARKPEARRLFILAVGINDYSAARAPQGSSVRNLEQAVNDAQSMCDIWAGEKPRLYSDAVVHRFLHDKSVHSVSRANLIASLEKLSGEKGPGADDQVIVFLSGHGYTVPSKEGGSLDDWVFCCPEFDVDKPRETGVTNAELYRALARIKARKLVILDSCHSGLTVGNPVRGLVPNGKGPIIFAACGGGRDDVAYEDPDLGHGLFTRAVMDALGDDFDRADTNKDGMLDAPELYRYLEVRIGELLEQMKKAELKKLPEVKRVLQDAYQKPSVFPSQADLEHYPLARKK